jgi:NADP-dependent 3-hydroxy acid dehydrogenase YdfG
MSEKKSILITGAASGIGFATARLFADKGWVVGAADLNEKPLRALVDEYGSDSIIPIVADVRSRTDAVKMVAALSSVTAGRLDCLFNSAGILRMGPHEEIRHEDIDRMIDVNVSGVVNSIDAAFPALRSTPGAHIVSMSSSSSEFGVPDHAVYAATKFFVKGLTEALNIEFARHDIQVSDVAVAYVQTPMVDDAEIKAQVIERIGVRVKPQSVAETVWKAAHGNRVHWRLGLDARIMNLVVRLMGENARILYRRLTGY